MAQFTLTSATDDTFRLISAATTNAAVAKPAGGKLHSIIASNTNAAVRYLKLYDKTAAPTVGTDAPFMTLALPPGQVVQLADVNAGFRAGLGIATTTGAADADTAAVAANEVIVHMFFR